MAIVSSTKGRYYEVLVERGLSRGSFFFFSSRRRHTRYWRDWSSDVCSSDLCWRGRGPAPHRNLEVPIQRAPRLTLVPRSGRRLTWRWEAAPSSCNGGVAPTGRSGEGRVGEEGRSRWAADPLKKKTTT